MRSTIVWQYGSKRWCETRTDGLPDLNQLSAAMGKALSFRRGNDRWAKRSVMRLGASFRTGRQYLNCTPASEAPRDQGDPISFPQ